MENYTTLLGVLIALLVGLATGKAWERYKLSEGRLVDRRRMRDSPHYLLGLNFLVSNQIDLAIEELGKAAELHTDSLEIQLILGNLYREKGQVGRAIQVHQTALQRPKLSRLEHANIMLCLGLDFKHGGFVDRALEAFNEVLRLDSKNQYALLNVEKLYEEQHQWNDAYATRQRYAQLTEPDRQAGNNAIMAFLENELGLDALKRMDYAEAARRFQAAIDLDSGVVPAYLNLGDVRFLEGDLDTAAATWETVLRVSPDQAYLAFERLESLYPRTGRPGHFPQLCRDLIAANQKNWRARLALARHLAGRRETSEALELLFEALTLNPHALIVHQTIWQTLSGLDLPRELVQRYIDLTRKSVFYLDPHVCMRCRYRSTEFLWHCPHCHEWNTFVEERISPAKEGENIRT